MSSIARTAAELVEPLAFKPHRDVADGWATPPAKAHFRLRRLLDVLRRPSRKCPNPGRGPTEPRETSGQPEDAWNDPALWMLMLH